jgi:hypothetical protein
VIAIMRAMGAAGAGNLDQFRGARERQHPTFYLAASYYESWAETIEALVLSRGIAAPDEMAARRSLRPVKPL